MSAIDRIGSTASLYIRPRPQDVSQAVPEPTPERSASLIGGGAAPSLSSNLANALWSLRAAAQARMRMSLAAGQI
jgi:hypothetical protein